MSSSRSPLSLRATPFARVCAVVLGVVFIFASVVWLGRVLHGMLANPNQPANLVEPAIYGLVWLATGIGAFVWGVYPALFSIRSNWQPSADEAFEKFVGETQIDRNGVVTLPASRSEVVVPAIFFSIMGIAATLAGVFYDDPNVARAWVVFGRGLSLGVACLLMPTAGHYVARLVMRLPSLRLAVDSFEICGVWRRRRVAWQAIRQIEVRPIGGVTQVAVRYTTGDGQTAELRDWSDVQRDRVLPVQSVYGFPARDLATLFDRCRSWAIEHAHSKAP